MLRNIERESSIDDLAFVNKDNTIDEFGDDSKIGRAKPKAKLGAKPQANF